MIGNIINSVCQWIHKINSVNFSYIPSHTSQPIISNNMNINNVDSLSVHISNHNELTIHTSQSASINNMNTNIWTNLFWHNLKRKDSICSSSVINKDRIK